MVRQGDFEVRLVDGDGRPIYKEHVDDKHNRGVFVEGEPGADFFIEVKRCPPDTKRRILEQPDDDGSNGDNNSKFYKLDFTVDEQDLGFYWDFTRPGATQLIGVWSRSADGSETMQALQFMKAQAENNSVLLNNNEAADSANNSVPFLSVCGKIRVRIYEAEKFVVTTDETAQKEKVDASFQSPFRAEDTVHMAQDQPEEFGKKLLRSAVGETAITTMPGRPWRRHSSGSGGSTTITTTTYKKRAYVDTIKLYYCSALGLIKAGILPSPEMYRLQQMVSTFNNHDGNKRRRTNNNSRRRIVTPEKPPVELPQPEKISVPINDDGGGGGGGNDEQQVLHREAWCFDLSQQSDGDDADNDEDDDVEEVAAVSQESSQSAAAAAAVAPTCADGKDL